MQVRNVYFTQTCHILALHLTLPPLSPVSINSWHVLGLPIHSRSDRINAGDGAKYSAFAGHWNKLGSNKTFHAARSLCLFSRLQVCLKQVKPK